MICSMRHVFLINPAAGKRDRTEDYTAQIRAALEGSGEPYEIHVSGARGDCTRLAREAAQRGDELRLYACGGDGTLNEVVNGAAGFPNAAVTHYPGGTGNDFIKSFSEQAPFSDLRRLLDAEEAKLDLIRCGDRLALNICSIGYDARIGTEVGVYKRLPLVSGTGAYILSTIVNTVRGIHRPYRVELDGQVFDGRQSMICVGNGRWYGGSFYPLPVAELDDGLLDVLLVHAASRATVIKVIGKYAKGRFAEYPELISHYRCRRVRVICEREEPVNLDGELLHSTDVTFELAEEKIRFFYPRGLSYAPEEKRKTKKTEVKQREEKQIAV